MYVHIQYGCKSSFLTALCHFLSPTCLIDAGGEVYAWGTNSMGQCGQGHSNGSIVTPSKVQGLDGVQVQQISAGTSHSVVWTAVPVNRFVGIDVTVCRYIITCGFTSTFNLCCHMYMNYGNDAGIDFTQMLFSLY